MLVRMQPRLEYVCFASRTPKNAISFNHEYKQNIKDFCHNLTLVFIFSGSIYSTLAVAIERYVSVCHPHFIPSHCAGMLSVAGLVIFSILFNVCRFLEFETTYEIQVSENK